MRSAARLMRDLHEELGEETRRLLHHPYFPALELGQVPEEALRGPFAGLWYQGIVADLRSAAMMVQRYGHTPARDFLNGFLQAEFAALEGLRPIARRLGMTQEDLERYEPTFEGFSYSLNLAGLAAFASAAEFTVAVVITVPTWAVNCARMGRALRANYGFTPQETTLLESSTDILPVENAALPLIQDALDGGLEPRRLYRAARHSKAAEKLFWDSMLPPGLGVHSASSPHA